MEALAAPRCANSATSAAFHVALVLLLLLFAVGLLVAFLSAPDAAGGRDGRWAPLAGRGGCGCGGGEGGGRWVLTLDRAIAPSRRLRPQAPAPPPGPPRAGARVRAALAADRFLAVPAVYSAEDEGFVVRLRLGADNVLAVLDSGSANLSVGTADCVAAALCSAHVGRSERAHV